MFWGTSTGTEHDFQRLIGQANIILEVGNIKLHDRPLSKGCCRRLFAPTPFEPSLEAIIKPQP